MITQRELKEQLTYYPYTGRFFWNNTRRGVKKGKRAGYVQDTRGYRIIMIDRKPYYAHRLAWLYEYGSFPELEIDHVNRDTDDNRISNLRDVTHSTNLLNSKRSVKSIVIATVLTVVSMIGMVSCSNCVYESASNNSSRIYNSEVGIAYSLDSEGNLTTTYYTIRRGD